MRDQDVITALVSRLYAALAVGDREELHALLDPAFVAEFAKGMPAGRGRHDGAAAARREGWGAVGRAFAAAAHAEEFVPCSDGRLLVIGTYRGEAHGTGRTFEAEFMHLWTARDGRLSHLRQITDTAAWAAALQDRAGGNA